MINCRRAKKEDVLLFKDIRLRALQESPDAFGTTYQDAVERDEASWEEQLHSTVEGDLCNTQFAFDGKDCIGLAAIYREPDESSGHLVMMWVDPEYRGSEAATLMVRSLLDWAKQVDFDSVELSFTRGNHRAGRFYGKMGFHSTGEEVDIDPERNLRGTRMIQSL